MKLSLIIPVYNVQKYVEKCIHSCMKQNVPYDEYEIIIINDGSTDNSLDVINHTITSSNNIKVFSQKNSGLSIARNNGLSYAEGDYVWFIDSDDYIEYNSLNTIFKYLDGSLDILQIQYRYVYENGELSKDASKTIIDGVKSGRDVLKNGGVDIPAQFSIYRRNFLLDNHLSFYPHIYHEDVEFKPRAIFLASRVASYDKIVYNYLQRANSITSKHGIKHANDLLVVSDSLYNFSLGVERKVYSYFASVITCNINWILFIMNDLSPYEKKKMITTLKNKRYLIKAMMHSCEFKYRLEAFLLLINIKVGKWIYLRLR